MNRRKRSDVWAHFKEVVVSSNNSEGILHKVVKMKCNSCNQYFTKSKGGTTSSLKRHMEVHCNPRFHKMHSLDETEESINVHGRKRKRSDVWIYFEEVEVFLKNSEGIQQKVVKLKCKCCNRHFTKSKDGTTSSLKRHLESHPHLPKTSAGTEDQVRSEVSDMDKITENGRAKRRSDVWTQFEEVVVTEKKQKGSNVKVEKLRCKKCKKLFTKSKDGCTSALKWHMEETCAIRNGKKCLLDYCIKS